MKKIMFLLMFLMMANVSYAYVDMDSNHWAYGDIVELKNLNIVSGYPDDTFRADSYITGEELITIFINGANDKIKNQLVNWPEDYMKMAKDNGLELTSEIITKKTLLELSNKVKKIKEIEVNGITFTNILNSASEFINERELVDLTTKVTRADACNLVNRLLKMSKTRLPIELTGINHNNNDIKTVINSIEIVDFNSYEGEYKEIIDQIKEGGHPYLDFRKKLAEGNYLMIVDFDTVNDSQYEVPTSYSYLTFKFAKQDITVIDAFDIDEVKLQVLDKPYSGVFVKSNNKYNTIAFYILNDKPQEVEISRDVNTLYDAHTNKYVNVNLLNSATIKF